ncbi:MAG: hypothetical protein Q8P26_00850 [Candidatus Levybacteria bacterium]|nr:hypothetical protein [Candidatus Levybacteria bacterium]
MIKQIEGLPFNLEKSPFDSLKNDVNRVRAMAGKEIRTIIGLKAKDILPKGFPLTGRIDIGEIYPTNSSDLKYMAVYSFDENQIYVTMRTTRRINPADKDNPRPNFLSIPRNTQPEEILRIISDTEWIKYGSKVIKIFEEIAMENKNGKKTIPPLPIPQIE